MSELKEYLKLKYMADCKCGKCQLVPDHVLASVDAELDLLRAPRTNALGAGLTPRQSLLLFNVRAYIEAKGYSPSYDELMPILGTTSKGNVARMIDVLVKRGHLLRGEPGQRRSLRLPDDQTRLPPSE